MNSVTFGSTKQILSGMQILGRVLLGLGSLAALVVASFLGYNFVKGAVLADVFGQHFDWGMLYLGGIFLSLSFASISACFGIIRGMIPDKDLVTAVSLLLSVITAVCIVLGTYWVV